MKWIDCDGRSQGGRGGLGGWGASGGVALLVVVVAVVGRTEETVPFSTRKDKEGNKVTFLMIQTGTTIAIDQCIVGVIRLKRNVWIVQSKVFKKEGRRRCPTLIVITVLVLVLVLGQLLKFLDPIGFKKQGSIGTIQSTLT